MMQSIPGLKGETWGNRHPAVCDPTQATKTKTWRGWGTQLWGRGLDSQGHCVAAKAGLTTP
jgi:hypothetical protein